MALAKSETVAKSCRSSHFVDDCCRNGILATKQPHEEELEDICVNKKELGASVAV